MLDEIRWQHETGAADRAAGSELWVAEANHRIGNNLGTIASLLRLYGAEIAKRRSDVSSKEVRDILCQISARIDAVGRLHRRLSAEPALRELELGPFLRDICDDLMTSACEPGHVDITYDFETDCRVSTDQVISLCLVISEVVTNAIKYAHPTGVTGRIVAGCRRGADGQIVIEVRDDGIGLPEGFDPVNDGGFGFRVVQQLSQQLNGICHFDSTDLGLQFRLELL